MTTMATCTIYNDVSFCYLVQSDDSEKFNLPFEVRFHQIYSYMEKSLSLFFTCLNMLCVERT